MSSEKQFINQQDIAKLSSYIKEHVTRPLAIMEVCGTHTMSIARWGIRELLPQQIELISGPGCPVCVTDTSVLAEAFALAQMPDTIFCCFGDMLRVPAGESSLLQLQDRNNDIRVVLSPLEALELAERQPHKQVIFFAVGFETTAPLTAAVIELAASKQVENFSVLCAHKTMPQAIRVLLQESRVDALICPGHVAAITGADSFAFISQELHRPAAIAGFEPYDIMLALAALVKDLQEGRQETHNCYPRIVSSKGNLTAHNKMQKVFTKSDSFWRGLGQIKGSGLAICQEYAYFDAEKRFKINAEILYDNPNCRCADILRGAATPAECPLFGTVCTQAQPQGACMVSGEGSCAAAFKYRKRG